MHNKMMSFEWRTWVCVLLHLYSPSIIWCMCLAMGYELYIQMNEEGFEFSLFFSPFFWIEFDFLLCFLPFPHSYSYYQIQRNRTCLIPCNLSKLTHHAIGTILTTDIATYCNEYSRAEWWEAEQRAEKQRNRGIENGLKGGWKEIIKKQQKYVDSIYSHLCILFPFILSFFFLLYLGKSVGEFLLLGSNPQILPNFADVSKGEKERIIGRRKKCIVKMLSKF